jgi:hypothetical protein
MIANVLNVGNHRVNAISSLLDVSDLNPWEATNRGVFLYG